MKNIKKLFTVTAVTLIAALTISVLPAGVNSAQAATKNIMALKFDSMIEKVVGESVLSDEEKDFLKNSFLTYQRAAQMLRRADDLLNGAKYDADFYDRVVSYGRISDRKKASNKQMKKDLTICFIKGIMIGKSNGKYSQSRKLSPKSKVLLSDANLFIKRLKNKKSRIKLTWDGQVTRKTNLPKNYKQFPYILASFPNSFYEIKFKYDNCLDGRPSAAANPKETQTGKVYKELLSNWENWEQVIATNLKCRLNYNYKSTDFNKWARTLCETYSGSSELVMPEIKAYRRWAKAAKTKIKSSKIVVEPSGLYCSDTADYYLRCLVRFRVDAKQVVSADSNDQNELIQGVNTYIPGLKNRTWTNLVIDVPVCFLTSGEMKVSGSSFVKAGY